MGEQHEPGSTAQSLSRTKKVGGWSAVIGGLAALIYALTHGGGAPPPFTPTCDQPARTQEYTDTCAQIWQAELGRPIDGSALQSCIARAQRCETGEQIRQTVHDSPEAVAYRNRPPEPPRAVRPFPAEAGRLRPNGDHWDDTNNEPWGWRGQTAFLLLARELRGEDTQPIIDAMVANGVNVARVLVGGVLWGGWEDYQRPWERPDFDATLGALADKLWAAGVRLEATVVTYRIDTATWRRVLQRVYDVAQTRTGMVVEAMNEPWVDKGDVVAMMQGVDRHGVLSAYSIAPIDGFAVMDGKPFLDYITPHLPRDMGHFPRNSKDLLEIRNDARKPTVGDEPLGIVDPAFIDRILNPNARELFPGYWSMDGRGGGARTTNTDAVVSHFAICRLLAMGCTIHLQSGLEGKVPTPGEQQIISEILKVWQFIPAKSQTCRYSAPHLGGFPIAWTVADSTVEHAYAAVCGNEAWLVNPLPPVGWSPVGANGWRVAAVGPRPWILRLEK